MRAALRSRLWPILASALFVFCCLLSNASAGSTLANYYSEVTGDHPAAFWKLDETSGSTAADSSGYGHNGIYVNSPALGVTTTLMGSPAVGLSGSQAITIPYSSQLNPSSYTLEAWVKLTSLPSGGDWKPILCSRDHTSYVQGYELYVGNYGGVPRFSLLVGGPQPAPYAPPGNYTYIATSNTTVAAGHWYHIVATVNNASGSSDLSLYVNGQEDTYASPAFNGLYQNCGDATTIGTCGNLTDTASNWFSGYLADVAIYPSVLSSDQIQAHFDAATSQPPASEPTLTLSDPSRPSRDIGNTVTFIASTTNVPNGTGVTASVTGANPQTLHATVQGGSATFSYVGSNAGTDTVEASVTVDGMTASDTSDSFDWTEPPPPAVPSIALSDPVRSDRFSGTDVSFTATTQNIPDGTVLTSDVTGANPGSQQKTVSGGTATFSYKSANPGDDHVAVSATVDGNTISASLTINWLAGASSTEASLGPVASSIGSSAGSSGAIYSTSAVASLMDPVNSSTGNFFQSLTDVSVPGTGVPFSFVRTYNSRDDSIGVLGQGWSASPYPSLAIDDLGDVTLKSGDGQEIAFAIQPDGSYQGASNVTATLTKSGSGYDLVQTTQVVQHFDSNGRIVSWLDANGQGLHFSYSGDGTLESVTDATGREYDFSYNDGGHLSGVSLPDESSLSYAYDGDLLTSFTDQTGAKAIYAYDSNGFLKSATDGSGKLLFENTYDDQGRVVTQKDASGNEGTFDWSAGGVTATDAQDNDWQDTYNDQGQLQTRTDALGNKTTYVYDSANDLISETDPLGTKTTYTYDDRGNMLSKTDPLGNTESWTYDQGNNVLSHTDALGNTTTYIYDSNGNLLTETDPLGSTTRYEYDSAGRLTKMVDPLNRVNQNDYDDQGNLISTISPSGAKTTYEYDALGRQISETDPLGHTSTTAYDDAGRVVKTTDALGNSTSTAYDDAGRVKAKTDPNGATTRYEYDANGRQVKVINPDGSSTESSYDAVDNLVASTDALGNVTKYEYDRDGRQTAAISPLGNRTEATYDADGNVVKTTDPLGRETTTKYDGDGREIEKTDPMGRTTKTVYDADGNVVKTIDALGNITTTKYDADGRTIETVDPLGHSTKSTYDAAGQTVSETDANGGITLHAYDPDGNEISTTDPSGGITTSTYDAAGNKLSETDPLGHTTTYSYDADGNQISETNPLGEKTTDRFDADGNQVAETDALGNTSKTGYDSMNREVERIDPLGNTTKTGYDANGNAVATADGLGNTTTSTYDADGRLAKETDPLGNSTISAYDKAGELISKTDANGHTTQYTYDAAGEKTSVTAPDGSVTSYAYDANGNLVKRTDANDHAIAYSYEADGNKLSKTDALGRTWRYSYDGVGNLTETKTPSGGTITRAYDPKGNLLKKSYSDGTPSVSYSYDAAGNKTSMVDGTGKTSYAYDGANDLVGASSPSGNFAYSYDQDGNLLSRTYPNGLVTSYTYNQASEMTTAKVGNAKTYYSYDPNGKLLSTLSTNGILDKRSYDASGRLTSISGTDPKGKPLYSRAYTYDGVGNPRTLVATAPRDHTSGWWGPLWHDKGADLTKWTETYSYDSQNRLKKACMNDSCSRYFSYSYDPVGNITSLETRRSKTFCTFDSADELLSTSKLKRDRGRPDVTAYAYDLNGNETKSGDTSYAYNLANELTQTSEERGRDRVSYTYTGDGLMATRSTRSVATSYAWDTSFDTPELAIETASRGQGRFQLEDARSYTYAEGPIGIVHGRDTLTFHTDSIGSVIELSDDHGRVVDSYRYTPFGDDYGPDASDDAIGDSPENPMRYAGQYLDSESGLYDMRAREYDPETGRFLEEDPLETDSGEPAVGVYVYASDQPTVLIDPSGECAAPGFAGDPGLDVLANQMANVSSLASNGSGCGTNPNAQTCTLYRYRYASSFFAGKGMKDFQVAGLMGNLILESGYHLNPTRWSDDHVGRGIAQWTVGSDRWVGLVNKYGASGALNFNNQVRYVWYEIGIKNYGNVYSILKRIPKKYNKAAGKGENKRKRFFTQAATYWVETNYEVPYETLVKSSNPEYYRSFSDRNNIAQMALKKNWMGIWNHYASTYK